jgi:hypothetical protein
MLKKVLPALQTVTRENGWFVLFVWFLLCVWMNQSNQKNRINQINPLRSSAVSPGDLAG